MNLLTLAREYGLEPKRKSSTYGGEYASSCPNCGGKDRFLIWPIQNRYWCRQCCMSGNTTTFHREFLPTSSHRVIAKEDDNGWTSAIAKKNVFPVQAQWEAQALQFVRAAHQRLLMDDRAMETIKQRHLNLHTSKNHQVGWNPIHRHDPREKWGLSEKDAKERSTIFIPPGIVIPTILSGKVIRISIRRSDWYQGACFGKYYIIPGSQSSFFICGYSSIKPLVLVEAELDAMLVGQECGSFCGVVATGGASKRPDMLSALLLAKAPLILFAMDFDEAGKKAFQFWKASFPRLHAWPVPKAKSPADAFEAGVNLREWIQVGLKHNANLSL
ncbi:MAG: hypothetical protein S4CHLAM123_03220 [Chlamydiales bacterium]|nr:hypothetical protein [Chlamydiales bacterium]